MKIKTLNLMKKKIEAEINTFASVNKLRVLKCTKEEKWHLFRIDRKVLELKVNFFEDSVSVTFLILLLKIFFPVNEIFMVSLMNNDKVSQFLKSDRIRIIGNNITYVREVELNTSTHYFSRNFLLNFMEFDEKSRVLSILLDDYLREQAKIKLN